MDGRSGHVAATVTSVAPGASVSATFKVTVAGGDRCGFLDGQGRVTGRAIRHQLCSGCATPTRSRSMRFARQRRQLDRPVRRAVQRLYERGGPLRLEIDQYPEPMGSRQSGDDPAGTKLAPKAFYLLGLASSGLVAPAQARRDYPPCPQHRGFRGRSADRHRWRNAQNCERRHGSHARPTLFIPVSTGPWLTIPAGATNLPVMNATGFEVGEKIGIDVGGKYEIVTVTAVGKAGTQTTLAAAANAGATNIKVAATANLTVGDTLTLGTGGRMEQVKVASVGSPARRHWRDLAAPLKFDHMRAWMSPSRHRHQLHARHQFLPHQRRCRSGAGQRHHARSSAGRRP